MACYTCQRVWRGWRACLGSVGGMSVPTWVRWLMCWRGWRTKVNSVGDIGRNIGSELDSVVGSALFLKLFPKTGRK